MNKNTQLDESFSQSGVLDVDELRRLYYGRLNVMTAFTDDGEYVYDSQISGKLGRPTSLLSHRVIDVVAKKVKSKEFYANIFRLKSSKKIVDDIKSYSNVDLSKDIEKIIKLKKLDEETTQELIEIVLRSSKSSFEKLWEITKNISGEMGGDTGNNWRNILLDLGYAAFIDLHGSGIFMKGNYPCVVYIDYDQKEDLDIVPIQRHRRDPRRRTNEYVARRLKRLEPARKRVAKAEPDFEARLKAKGDSSANGSAIKYLVKMALLGSI